VVGSADSSQYLTEQEFNTGKNAFINMLTYKEPIAKKVEWKPSTVESIPPLTLPTTTVRDWGEPPFQGGFTGDTRKIANPHSTRYYTVGKK